MKTEYASYSGFLRTPTSVLPLVESADVVLERRDGDDLVLSTASRARALHEGLAVGAAALRNLTRLAPDLVCEALLVDLPWIKWLPDDEQRTCLMELTDDLAASVEVDSFVRFHNDLAAWRSTAEVWSDPALAERLTSAFDDEAGEVERAVAGDSADDEHPI